MALAYHRGGSGEPLVLLHGIGSHWHMWEPVLGALEAEHDVLAVDLPGFGDSALLPGEPHPEALAAAVAALLDEQGIERAHVAGNSLGGWVALELARRGRTASVCALSPAGFWNRWERAYATASLRSSRASAVLLRERAERIYGNPALRVIALSQLVARPAAIPAEAAVSSLRNLADSPGWDATLAAMARRHVTGLRDVEGPVTVAWGEHDRLLLPRQAQRARAALPFGRHVTLVGCGHVPTWDDPGLVARAILSSAA